MINIQHPSKCNWEERRRKKLKKKIKEKANFFVDINSKPKIIWINISKNYYIRDLHSFVIQDLHFSIFSWDEIGFVCVCVGVVGVDGRGEGEGGRRCHALWWWEGYSFLFWYLWKVFLNWCGCGIPRESHPDIFPRRLIFSPGVPNMHPLYDRPPVFVNSTKNGKLFLAGGIFFE